MSDPCWRYIASTPSKSSYVGDTVMGARVCVVAHSCRGNISVFIRSVSGTVLHIHQFTM